MWVIDWLRREWKDCRDLWKQGTEWKMLRRQLRQGEITADEASILAWELRKRQRG